MSTGTSPNTLGTQPVGDAGSSRGSSPDGTGEILEHSMESLIVSDSSEEGATVEAPEGLTLRLDQACQDAEQLEEETVNILCEDEEDPQFEESTAPILWGQEEGKATTKGKKRRISSRRERKISLKASDRAVCKIAGVEVTSQTPSPLPILPP